MSNVRLDPVFFIVAKKAVAHKLARACFYVLRDQVEFDVNKAFGYSQ